jgi:hypothetical protein
MSDHLPTFCRVGEFFGVPFLEHAFGFVGFGFDLFVVLFAFGFLDSCWGIALFFGGDFERRAALCHLRFALLDGFFGRRASGECYSDDDCGERGE